MVVCRYWQQGHCRFGDGCRYEHPGANEKPSQNTNRFASLQPPSHNTSQGRDGRGSDQPPYGLTTNGIIADLSNEKPQWVLSAYGPGLKAPAQLFGGPLREQSFEEMRLHYYMGMASGNPAGAAQEADKLIREAEQQNQNALQNADAAMQYVLNAENEHPNRLDICNQGAAQSHSNAPANPFGNPPSTANTTSNAFGAPQQGGFGQPSALGQKPNPFGGSSQPTSGAFGQPSALGSKPNPFGGSTQSTSGAFGQPSALGAKPNPFGGSSQPTTGAFGQTSALGAKPNPFGAPAGGVGIAPAGGGFAGHAAKSSPFGAPSQAPVSNPFGQPVHPSPVNPFGSAPQAAAPPNPFGAPSQPTQPFGIPSPAPAPANPFGQPAQTTNDQSMASATSPVANPFAQPNQSAQKQNPFGGSSQTPSSNPFGQPSQPAAVNPFGQPAFAQSSPFGQPAQSSKPNPFGQPQTGVNPFGAQPSQPNKSAGGGEYTPSAPSANGITGAKSPYHPDSTVKHPLLTSYATVQQNGDLTMFKGKTVRYKDGVPFCKNRDGSWEKIWFPEGPPPYNRDTEVGDDMYDSATKEAYMKARETGSFEGGMMPLMPPKREWCVWDF